MADVKMKMFVVLPALTKKKMKDNHTYLIVSLLNLTQHTREWQSLKLKMWSHLQVWCYRDDSSRSLFWYYSVMCLIKELLIAFMAFSTSTTWLSMSLLCLGTRASLFHYKLVLSQCGHSIAAQNCLHAVLYDKKNKTKHKQRRQSCSCCSV